MMAIFVAYHWYLFLLSVIRLSHGNVLDIQRCIEPAKTRILQKVLSENTASVIRKAQAKSNVECIFFCMKEIGCQATFFMKSLDRCYLLANPNAGILDASQSGVVGQYTSMLSVQGQEAKCDSVNCPSGSTCSVECDPTLGTLTLCIADNSQCDITQEYTNIRHYGSTIVHDQTDNGIVQTVVYPKTRSDSMIRLRWFSTLRAHYNSFGCGRWFFTFNGTECSSPYPIDFLDYNDVTGDMHRGGAIDGTCRGLPAGNVTIDLRVSNCPGYGCCYDSWTGWMAARHWTITEIIPQTTIDKPCPGLSVFNYFYTTLYRQICGGYQVVFWTSYKKVAADTALRIKYEAVMRVLTNDGNYRCGRWYLKIDGIECSPVGDIVIHTAHSGINYHRDPHRTKTLEAICENISPGAKYIEVYSGPCTYTQVEPADFCSGWNSPSRVHVEEVRLSKAVAAVYTPSKTIMKNPIFNIMRVHYWLMNEGQDNGLIRQNTYVKTLSNTALRVTATGDMRACCASPYCSRWYFMFNGAECSNPYTIDAVDYFNYDSNFHQPMQVSGMCYGLNAGSITVGLYIMNCPGYGIYDGFTGWGSAFHIIMEEVYVEQISRCGTTAPVLC